MSDVYFTSDLNQYIYLSKDKKISVLWVTKVVTGCLGTTKVAIYMQYETIGTAFKKYCALSIYNVYDLNLLHNSQTIFPTDNLSDKAIWKFGNRENKYVYQ